MVLRVGDLPASIDKTVSLFSQLVAAMQGYTGPLTTTDALEGLADVICNNTVCSCRRGMKRGGRPLLLQRSLSLGVC